MPSNYITFVDFEEGWRVCDNSGAIFKRKAVKISQQAICAVTDFMRQDNLFAVAL